MHDATQCMYQVIVRGAAISESEQTTSNLASVAAVFARMRRFKQPSMHIVLYPLCVCVCVLCVHINIAHSLPLWAMCRCYVYSLPRHE